MSSYGLRVLGPEECEAALASQHLGRVAVPANGHPLVLPVVYSRLDGDIVFRTAPGEKLIAAALNRVVAFEIDAFDENTHTGWSVNVVGPAEEVTARAELDRVASLQLVPWAGEVRDRVVRIRAQQISGRAIDPPEPG